MHLQLSESRAPELAQYIAEEFETSLPPVPHYNFMKKELVFNTSENNSPIVEAKSAMKLISQHQKSKPYYK